MAKSRRLGYRSVELRMLDSSNPISRLVSVKLLAKLVKLVESRIFVIDI